METEIYDIVRHNTFVSNLAQNMESTNTVSIHLHEVILQEERRVARRVGSHRMCYKPLHGFTASNLSQFLHEQEVLHSQQLGEAIDGEINHSLATITSLREPVFVTVNISFIQDRRLRPVDLKETSDVQCSICIENFSDSRENTIRMPQCTHVFHQDCLVEWLSRQNSCPLCRSSVSVEDEEWIVKLVQGFDVPLDN